MSLNSYGPNRQVTILGLKWWLWIIPVILLLGATAWALGWIGAGARIISPENVRVQWQFAYDYQASLEATANNVCRARQDEKAAPEGTTERSQRTSQRIAQEQNYERIRAQYDARLADAFRAKLVRPPDVPDHAPTLEEMLKQIHCTTSA